MSLQLSPTGKYSRFCRYIYIQRSMVVVVVFEIELFVLIFFFVWISPYLCSVMERLILLKDVLLMIARVRRVYPGKYNTKDQQQYHKYISIRKKIRYRYRFNILIRILSLLLLLCYIIDLPTKKEDLEYIRELREILGSPIVLNSNRMSTLTLEDEEV